MESHCRKIANMISQGKHGQIPYLVCSRALLCKIRRLLSVEVKGHFGPTGVESRKPAKHDYSRREAQKGFIFDL